MEIDETFNKFKDEFCSELQKQIDELPFLIKPFKDEFISDLESVKSSAAEKGKGYLDSFNQSMSDLNHKVKNTNGFSLLKSKISQSDFYKYIHTRSVKHLSDK
jgi:hypothetical protein